MNESELKDILYRLEGYDSSGWEIVRAEKYSDGNWILTVHKNKEPVEESLNNYAEPEVSDESN